ncbi:MAG TPA: hypothetical protein VF039_10205 [Longimicrobiales bacterium]
MTTVSNERGFVLSMVIFAVAALSIAGTALFLVVQSENAMANAGAESSAALHLANAGLARYMGETVGQPRDSVTYSMGDGEVTVTATLAVPLADTAALYMIRSEAQIRDRVVSGLASRRSVQQFARLRLRPFNAVAALALPTDQVRTHPNTVIDGRDACGVRDVLPLATAGAGRTYASAEEMLAAVGAEWDLLTDSTIAFDFEDRWPGWALATMAADSFPTVRFSDDVTVGGFIPPSGRGLLVVDGTLTVDSRWLGWTWDGVILADAIAFSDNAIVTINGAVMTGFDGGQQRIDRNNALKNASILYDSCKVQGAGARMAMFSPVPNTWWESPD